MTNDAVAIAAIVMLGVLLSVIAWQLLARNRPRPGHRGAPVISRLGPLLRHVDAHRG